MALEYIGYGTAVSNKAIPCTQATTLNGTSLYMGRVKGLAAHTVVGTASASYGVWAGSAKSGTRLTVLAAGIPSGTAQCLWDLQSGRIYTTTSRTVYGYYWKYADLHNEGRIYQINIPFQLEGTVADVYCDNSPWDIKFGEYQISIDGNRPTGTLNLALRTATAGAGSYATITLASAETRRTAGFKTITNGLSFDTSTPIVIRGAGYGFANIKITLREKLE